MNETYSSIYIFNGIKYSVFDTLEVHSQLERDPNFLASYIQSNDASLEASAGMDEHQSCVEASESCAAPDILACWNSNNIKLFLELYRERKDKFRDPKCKKRNLWKEIMEEMKKRGYEAFNEDMLDRKMRNLKKTYRSIKDNNKKSSTGRGRITWAFYDTFEEIFANDSTINFGPTVSSFRPIIDTLQPSSNSRNVVAPVISSSASPLLDPASIGSPSSPDNFNENLVNVSDTEYESPTSKRAKKSRNSKEVYNLRKKLVSIESERIEAIHNLENTIKESNSIQKERNALLKRFLDAHNNN